MDVSIRDARKRNDEVSACAYVTMSWRNEESDEDISETAYILFAYTRVGGTLSFNYFLPHDVSPETFNKMTEWNNEKRMQLVLASMTDYAINNNLNAY